MKGYVHVYTGDGKGKTTAAFGLALRAVGAGFQVFIGQFLKGSSCSELESVERLSPSITLRQYGRKGFIRAKPSKEDIDRARSGLDEIAQVAQAGRHRMVILDEANVAIRFGLFPIEDLLDIIDRRHPSVEMVLTGRDADRKIIDRADLVTEMREIKHYYKKGVTARVGIEK